MNTLKNNNHYLKLKTMDFFIPESGDEIINLNYLQRAVRIKTTVYSSVSTTSSEVHSDCKLLMNNGDNVNISEKDYNCLMDFVSVKNPPTWIHCKECDKTNPENVACGVEFV